ncbi:MAG: DUF4405 domain-containing protein [Thermodesulfobacteriota bacterium]
MKKIQLKFITVTVLFSSLTTLLFTGLLMWLVIPTGQTGNPYFLGLHRHSWADIHLFFSVIFTLGSFLHIYLSWNQVVIMAKKYFGDQSKYLIAMGLSFLPLTIIAWLFKLITD